MEDSHSSVARSELLDDLFDFPGIFTLEDYVHCFEALGNDDRLVILHQLKRHGSLTPSELAGKTEHTPTRIEEMCGVLSDAGLATRRIGSQNGETVERYTISAVGEEFHNCFAQIIEREREAVDRYTDD